MENCPILRMNSTDRLGEIDDSLGLKARTSCITHCVTMSAIFKMCVDGNNDKISLNFNNIWIAYPSKCSNLAMPYTDERGEGFQNPDNFADVF